MARDERKPRRHLIIDTVIRSPFKPQPSNAVGSSDLGAGFDSFYEWYGIPESEPFATYGTLGEISFGQTPSGLDTEQISDVSLGGGHVLAIDTGGRLWAWGWNSDGQTALPPDLLTATVTSIAAGRAHSLAVDSTGVVYAWGRNADGQCDTPSNLTDGTQHVIAVAAGSDHSLALIDTGEVICWGDNFYGQSSPTHDISADPPLVLIAAGKNHSLAVDNTGAVWAWGDNADGQCAIPGGLSPVVAIAGGGSHTLILEDTGDVLAYGLDTDGQSTVPGGLINAVAIAAGANHSVALDNTGVVWSWGNDDDAQVTDANAGEAATLISASVDYNGTIVALLNREAVAWREVNGTAARDLLKSDPVPAGPLVHFDGGPSDAPYVEFDDAFQRLAAAYSAIEGDPSTYHIIAVVRMRAGSAETDRLFGITDGSSAVVVRGDTGGLQTTENDDYSDTPVDSSGAVGTTEEEWFAGEFGCVRGGSLFTRIQSVEASADTPNPFTLLGSSFQLGGGSGIPAGWGESAYGKTTPPAGLSDLLSQDGGHNHTVGLKSDGTVVCWGLDNYGQSTVPGGLVGVIGVGAGWGHTVALKSDGTVVCWGINSYGQSTVPGGLVGVIGVAAGDYHTLALYSPPALQCDVAYMALGVDAVAVPVSDGKRAALAAKIKKLFGLVLS